MTKIKFSSVVLMLMLGLAQAKLPQDLDDDGGPMSFQMFHAQADTLASIEEESYSQPSSKLVNSKHDTFLLEKEPMMKVKLPSHLLLPGATQFPELDDPTKLFQCPIGKYYEEVDGYVYCKDCMRGCSECSSKLTCQVCQSDFGWYLDQVTSQCKRCQLGCLKCTSYDQCEVCRSGTFSRLGQCFCTAEAPQVGVYPYLSLDYTMSIIEQTMQPDVTKLHITINNLNFMTDLFQHFGPLMFDGCSRLLDFTSSDLNLQTYSNAFANLRCSLYPMKAQSGEPLWTKRALLVVEHISDQLSEALKANHIQMSIKWVHIDCQKEVEWEMATNGEKYAVKLRQDVVIPVSQCIKWSEEIQGMCQKCIRDQLLDLSTYKCVEQCPENAIGLKTQFSMMSNEQSLGMYFCRTFDPYTRDITLYIDNDFSKPFEDGTQLHPYSNLAFAFLEAFNHWGTLKRFGHNIYNLLLSDGDHLVFSGILPLFMMSTGFKISPATQYAHPEIIFERTFDLVIENYYYQRVGHSIGEMNYHYGQLPHEVFAKTFHSNLDKSYIMSFGSQLVITDASIRQIGHLNMDDAIIAVIGEKNSSISLTRCQIDVKALIVNNVPASISIIDSYVSLVQNNYLINSKHQTIDADNEVIIHNTSFEDDASHFNLAHRYPLIYVQGYKNFEMTGSTIRYRKDHKGMPTVMAVHAGYYAQSQSRASFSGNLIEKSNDFCWFLGSEQVAPLNFVVEVRDNIIRDCQQQFLPVMKVRFSENTTGSVTIDNNNYQRITLINRDKDELNPLLPSQTTTFFSFRNLLHAPLSLSNEVYESMKTYHLITANLIQTFQQYKCTYEDLRTVDKCTQLVLDDEDDVSSFINVANAGFVSFSRNKYSSISLGEKRILHRFTDSQSIILSDSLYENIIFFDESRLAVFQEYQSLVFQNNHLKNFELTDSQGLFMIWSLITGATDNIGDITSKFLGNIIETGIENKLGYLWFENESIENQISLEIKNQVFPVALAVPQDQIKVLGTSPVIVDSDLGTHFCKPEQTYNSETCEECPISNCEFCGGPTLCLRCLDTFVFNPSTNQCETQLSMNTWCPNLIQQSAQTNCPEGQLYDLAALKCSNCIDHCVVCGDFISCKECNFGYVTNSQGLCVLKSQKDDNIIAPEQQIQNVLTPEEIGQAGCVRSEEQDKCLECGYNTIRNSVNGIVRCDCKLSSKVLFKEVSYDNGTLSKNSVTIILDNLQLNENLQTSTLISFGDLFTAQNPTLDAMIEKYGLNEGYTLEYIMQTQILEDGTEQKWYMPRTQFIIENIPVQAYEGFEFGAEMTVKLENNFQFLHCQYPAIVYHNEFQINYDSMSFANEIIPSEFTPEPIIPQESEDPSIFKFQQNSDLSNIRMEMNQYKGIAFSTYFGISIQAQMSTFKKKPQIEAPLTDDSASNDTSSESEETPKQEIPFEDQIYHTIFCDVFAHDPIYNIDVRFNSKHFHFYSDQPLEQIDPENPPLMKIDLKTNFPYFDIEHPDVTVLAKCKLVYDPTEENTYTNDDENIEYDIVLEKVIHMTVNQKFYTLYSISDHMALPMIYLTHYQLIQYREKLNIDQVNKAIQGISASLLNIQTLNSLDDKTIMMKMVQSVSEEIERSDLLMESEMTEQLQQVILKWFGKPIEKEKIEQSDGEVPSLGEETIEIPNSKLDFKNEEPTEYKAMSIDSFTQISKTLDTLLTTEKTKANNNEAANKTEEAKKQSEDTTSKLVETFQQNLNSLSTTLSTDGGTSEAKVQGQSISAAVSVYDNEKITNEGATIGVPVVSNDQKSKGQEITVEIPANCDQIGEEPVVIKAVAMDSEIIQNSEQKLTESDKQFASNVVAVNIDQNLKKNGTKNKFKTLKLKNLKKPIKVKIPIIKKRPHDSYQCSFYNETTKVWETLPGQIDDSQNAMNCQTTHLSEFAVLVTRSDDRRLVLAVLGFLDALVIGSLIAAFILDRRDKSQDQSEQQEVLQRNSSFFENEINSDAQQKLYHMMQRKKAGSSPIEESREEEESVRLMEGDLEESEPQSFTNGLDMTNQDISFTQPPNKRNIPESQQKKPESFHEIMHKNHRLLSLFTPDATYSRSIRTITIQSQFHLAFFITSIILAIDALLNNLNSIVIAVMVFFAIRIMRFVTTRYVLTEFANKKARCCLLIFIGLIYLCSQSVPVLLSWNDPTIARDVALITGTLVVLEITLWDMLILPVSILIFRKCRKLKNE